MARFRGMQRCSWMLLLFFAGTAGAQNLQPFGSERELARYLEKIEETGGRSGGPMDGEFEQVVVTGARTGASITNNQTSGVDEGGIVKLVGDHLVVLRRGRLFTVSLAGDRMRPVSWIDAYAPGVEADGAWYDEMLVYKDRIVVIGYSYDTRATEINLFRLDSSGGLRFEASYLLRSTDYYSASNYASRLIGDQLVFYTALPATRGMASLPAMFERPRFAGPKLTPEEEEEADKAEVDPRFEPITSARRIYRPPYPLERNANDPALHTITQCDLSKPALECKATSVIGSYSQVFYVSATAVYVWTALNTARPIKGEDADDAEEVINAFVYRLPLDGRAPTALPAAGMPLDQFSFLEEGRHLNVLVLSNGQGNWMWNALASEGSPALLRVPLSEFGNGRQEFDSDFYRPLPSVDFGNGSLTNRFVGRHLLYGVGDSWGEARGKAVPLHIVPIDGETQTLSMPHSIDRIDVIGSDAIVIGTDADDDLFFSGIRLSGAPRVVQSYSMADAEQGELRSHGFFYDVDRGVFGLPVRSSGSGGSAHLKGNSAGITFIANLRDRFDPLGVLQTEEDEDEEDGCVASCVDWYGNARPIFIGNRVFALLGYELVEGKMSGGKIREKARVGFAPYVGKV